MTETDASERVLEAYYGDLEFREVKGGEGARGIAPQE
jgi:hypothetical protein